MKEPSLLRISVFCSIFGLIVIFYASLQPQPMVDICSITVSDAGMAARVSGTITSARVSSGHIFLDITNATCSIRYVIFNSSAAKMESGGGISPYSLGVGTRVVAQGIVDEYPKGSGRPEIVYSTGDIEVY